MQLNTTPPQAVADSLRRAGVDGQKLVICIPTDINLLGQYGRQWVLSTARGVWVIDEAAPDSPVIHVAFDEAQEFRTLAVVGSGLLQARVGGVWLDLARYSNRMKYPFGRVARRLDQARKGEGVVLDKGDEHDPRRCARCGLMLEFPGETCPRCINRGRAFSRAMQLIKPYWRVAALMMVLLLLGIGLDMFGPQLTRYLVDHVLKLGNPAASGGASASHPAPPSLFSRLAPITNPVHLLLIVVGLLAATHIARALINVFNGRLASRVGTSITFDIRGRLVDHLAQLSLGYYDKQQVGSLVGRVAYDTDAVQGVVSQLTGGFLMRTLQVVFSAGAMFLMAPKLAIWTLLPAPFVLCGTFLFYRFVYPNYRRFWDRSSRQAGMLNGILSGIRVVKAFAQEEREHERFQRSSGTLRDARRKVDMSSATFYPLMGLAFQMGGWIVWYVGGREVLGYDPVAKEGITLGTLMAFFGYMHMFYGPLSELTHLTSWLTHVSTQMQRIFEVLDTPIMIPEDPHPVRLPTVKGDIEFRGVTFGYSRQTPILKNVGFKIEAGQMIGVVGRSGSGKTTIINLISRFYDVDEGHVLIDGIDVQRIGKNDLRRHIGVVLQEPFLFRGTLWENMIYGQADSTIEGVIAASKAGNSHDFIMRQMHGYDTWVGERGAGLSGGERQRLSIARALLCEPRVLILDEATSSVDSESELAIQTALGELVKGRTSIIIAHRLSTLRNCDRILVVDEGRIIEQGSHLELMRLDKHYAKLVRIQTSVSKQASVDELKTHEEHLKAEKDRPPEVKVDPDTGLTPMGYHRPRWLTPKIANIHLGNRGALHVTVMNEGIYNGVFALRCMPVRCPNEHISLRYINSENREQEVGLLRDLADWPAEGQKLIRESLGRRYFIHTITGVEAIREFQGYLSFTVETDLGPMEFIMRWTTHAAYDYGKNGKILLDVEDNRYVIPEVGALPSRDRTLFERYVYW